MKNKFYETNRIARVILYIFIGISFGVLTFAHISYFTGNKNNTAFLLTELSATMLSLGVWGGVFFELLAKKFKKS